METFLAKRSSLELFVTFCFKTKSKTKKKFFIGSDFGSAQSPGVKPTSELSALRKTLKRSADSDEKFKRMRHIQIPSQLQDLFPNKSHNA